MADEWSNMEVEVIVQDYFSMLAEEIAGRPYNKAAHRRSILPLLTNRSEASIEFKHQNISAVLAKLGEPFINGYKPAWNYQKLLEEVVLDHLTNHPQVEDIFKLFADSAPVILASSLAFENIVEEMPMSQPIVHEAGLVYRNPVKTNYIELEQSNRRIGKSGEEIVFEYEQWRLIKASKESLASKIEWVSQTKGDGLGFDILSRNTNGTDRYIEVKSTKLTKEAPIYFSKNEYEFSIAKKSNYYLYRVFNLKHDPKMFIAQGTFDDVCSYHQPVKFKGYF